VLSVARPISSIEQEIRSLSTSDQEGLLRVLLEELDGPPDADSDSAWQAEVQRRSAEIDSGAAKGVSADEVFETIDASLKK
jgi:putative addiction module component (TIGR02574 family)